MNIYSKAISFALLLVVAAAHAQPTKDIRSMFPKNGAKGRDIVSLQSMTVEQQRVLTEGTRKDPNGYLRVDVTSQYVNILSELNILSEFKQERGDEDMTVNGLIFLGMKDEGKFKKNLAFGSRSGAEIFITGWKFAADGTSIVQTQEFVNQEIDGLTGTLSLAVAPDTDKCIWKLFVANSEISFDIMIVDTMQNKSPKMTPQKVREIAKKLIAHTQTKL